MIQLIIPLKKHIMLMVQHFLYSYTYEEENFVQKMHIFLYATV